MEELISEADKIMVMGHTNGDMDSMGASMGIYRLAKALEKEAYVIYNETGVNLQSFVDTAKEEPEYVEAIINKSEALSKIYTRDFACCSRYP